MSLEDREITEAMEIDAHNGESDDSDHSDEDVELTSLTSDLHTLALTAQQQLYAQPRTTQQKLVYETRDLYKAYSHHGSMIRLSSQLQKYLTAPTLSSTGKPLKIYSDSEVKMLNEIYTSTTIPSLTDRSFEGLCSAASATVTDKNGQQVSYNNSPESTIIVHETDFTPADINLTFPQHLDIPKEFLSALNNILLLQNAYAQAKLQHHVGKYCFPAPGSPNGHPHALPLLRLGISSATTSTLNSIFSPAATDPLGLTPESRTLLRQFYDAQTGRIDSIEISWLARCLRVELDVVVEWWSDMDRSMRGDKMMRVWCARRELERAAWYRKNGMH